MATELAAARPAKDRGTVRDLLLRPATQTVIKQILPRHMTPDRLTRTAIMAVQNTPKLGQCEPMTLLGAFLSCSALGLEPNTPMQHVYLIPFENRRRGITEVQLIIGYRGYMELARRSGMVRGQHADVVLAGDEFELEYGTEAKLRHKPAGGLEQRGEPLWSYCHVKLEDGQAFLALPWSDVLKTRERSQGYKSAVRYEKTDNPWMTDPLAMGRKTAIRRLYAGGEVPLSLEMMNAVALDEHRVDFDRLSRSSAEEIKEAAGSFAEIEHMRADDAGGDDEGQDQEQGQDRDDRGHDRQTGEVRDGNGRPPELVAPQRQARPAGPEREIPAEDMAPHPMEEEAKGRTWSIHIPGEKLKRVFPTPEAAAQHLRTWCEAAKTEAQVISAAALNEGFLNEAPGDLANVLLRIGREKGEGGGKKLV